MLRDVLCHHRMRARAQWRPQKAPADPAPEGFAAETFDRVLLDGPCTGLGQRPRLLVAQTLKQLEAAAHYQRLLMREAAHLLTVGGEMVYSTCTLSPMENEGNVAWLLGRYPQMQLVAHAPRLGGPGLEGTVTVPRAGGGTREEARLSGEGAALVQRCGPDAGSDTISFFVAKLRKTASIPVDDFERAVPRVAA